MWRRRRTDRPPTRATSAPAAPPPPVEGWSAWRDGALAAAGGTTTDDRPSAAPAGGGVAPGAALGVTPGGEAPPAPVTGVVVDLGYPPAWATLAVAADGAATLAASSGGRASAPPGHADQVLATAEATLHLLPPAQAFPLPPVGSVAFHVRTTAGGRSRTVPEAELRSLEHPLTLLFSAVQAVLAELRPEVDGTR